MSEHRSWYNVGVVKIAHADRDVARAVLGDSPGDRFRDIVGADTPDDDDRFPVGTNCTYGAYLTAAEAEEFRAASNCRYVVQDVPIAIELDAATALPGWRPERWVDADGISGAPGTGVNVAVLDTGTSSAARTYMNYTLVARNVFTPLQPPVSGEPFPDESHGSLVSGIAVPYGGRLLDGLIIDNVGFSSDAIIAQAVTWCVTNGAKVVNGSFSMSYGSTPPPATRDALLAASSSDIVFYFSLGNNGINAMPYPAAFGYVVPIPYVYSVGAYDMSLGYLSSFSNWHAQATGVAPGEMVRSIDLNAVEGEWAGTSVASPIAARLCARLVSAGATARAAGAALASTCVDLGHGARQGGGRFSMRAAAEQLGIVAPAAVSTTSTSQSPAPWLVHF